MAVSKSGDELRSMVREMKTRSPQEVMGDAATRSLMGSVVTAAIGVIGLLIVSTLVIFLVLGPPVIREKPKPKPITSAAAGTPIEDTDATAEATENTVGEGTGATTEESDPIEAMGIGETKDPDSETDSLDNRLDDLLQGLE